MTRPRVPAPRRTQPTEPDDVLVADAARATDGAARSQRLTPIATDRADAALRALVRLLARQAAAEHAATNPTHRSPHDQEAKPDAG